MGKRGEEEKTGRRVGETVIFVVGYTVANLDLAVKRVQGLHSYVKMARHGLPIKMALFYVC